MLYFRIAKHFKFVDKLHIEFQRKSPIQFENDYFCRAKSKLSQTDGSEEPNNK